MNPDEIVQAISNLSGPELDRVHKVLQRSLYLGKTDDPEGVVSGKLA